MKIVIDLRIYGPRPGGLGRYNQKLLEELIKLDKVNQYILLFKAKPEDLPALPENFSITIVNCHWYTLEEQIVIPWVLYKLKPDLVHFPHFNVPIFYRQKFVVTIHDLIMTKYPSRRASQHGAMMFAGKYWLYNIIIKSAIHRAQQIIAVSNFGAQDIVSYFHLSDAESKKIKVVYEGVTKPVAIGTENVNLPAKFWLYVGNAYPHKNLEFLIRAFKEFLTTHPDHYLVLVGNKNYFYERLAEDAKEIMADKNDRVIFAGYVPDNLLGQYYQQAIAYIFPSLYEGFGLPPLEAMTYNTPVLSSEATCLPEILGQAALYFNPHDVHSLLEQMNKIVSDNKLVEQLKLAGQEQIKKYSWVEMAKNILDIYNNCK